jgi:hypothetical protein
MTLKQRREELEKMDRKRLKNIHRAYYQNVPIPPEDKRALIDDIILRERAQGVYRDE